MVNDWRAWRAAAAAVLLCLAIAGSHAAAGLRSPLSGTGDLSFALDAPVFPTADGARADFAVTIFHPQMTFKAGPGGLSAVVELHLKLARQGFVGVDTTQVYVLHASDETDAADARRYQVVELSLPVAAGHWAITAEVSDRQGSTTGLLGGHATGKGTGVLVVPDWSAAAAQPRLSDLEFRAGSARDGGLLPHPDRLYGVQQDTLEAYLEVLGAPPNQSLSVRMEISDPGSGAIDHDDVTLVGSGDRRAALYRLPLASFLEGGYVLRAVPSWAPDQANESEFIVSWRIDAFLPTARDPNTEAEVLLTGTELLAWRKASRTTQLELLQKRWDALDPTPGTTENEVYDEYLARLAHARRFFGELLTPGQSTDRGRTYIRYGPPAEISLEVIPFNKDDLEDAITMVHEQNTFDRPGLAFKQAVPVGTSPGVEAQRDRERNEMSTGKEGAWELWRYQLHGTPLVPDQNVFATDVDLRFLFVDRLGTGEYKLDFSNLTQER